MSDNFLSDMSSGAGNLQGVCSSGASKLTGIM